MRKGKNSAGALFIESDRNEKFIDQFNAAAACQVMALNMVMQGYLTSSYMSPENKIFECCVHIESKAMPKVSKSYNFTWKEITSHTHFDEYDKTLNRIRCITYHFEY